MQWCSTQTVAVAFLFMHPLCAKFNIKMMIGVQLREIGQLAASPSHTGPHIPFRPIDSSHILVIYNSFAVELVAFPQEPMLAGLLRNSDMAIVI